jgi:hypothetical protein
LNDVDISQRAVEDLMRDIDGPVGNFMRGVSLQMAAVATAVAPVIKPGSTWSARSSAYRLPDGRFKPPGYLKSHITSTVGHSRLHDNYVFGGAEAPGDSGLFLEAPAEQLHEKHPFLSTGLESIVLD